MDTKRIESFKQFAKYLKYPMVVFEAETGTVVDRNQEAAQLLGEQVKTVRIDPGRAITKGDFWESLQQKKSVMWQRIRLYADEREQLVSGLVNEAIVDGRKIYTLLFEPQADLNLGNLILERILKNANLVAIHMGKQGAEYRIKYISKNINQYGYTRDQFYEGKITISDLVCKEDFKRVENIITESVARHQEEISYECRIFTEARELRPVRVHNHYVYNDYGTLTNIEMLIFDLGDEMNRNKENTYLSNAVSKMKHVVIVKGYYSGKNILKYISPNAGIMGMNIEALKKGYRLTGDYIHPEDRAQFVDSMYQAIASGITDYEQVYRMVKDDGTQIWVHNQVTINQTSEQDAEVSFLLTDITEQKRMEEELAAAEEVAENQSEPEEKDNTEQITINANNTEMLDGFRMMAETLCQGVDYYSTVLDAEGNMLITPMGPACDMGQFYDIVERPEFKEQFEIMAQKAKEQFALQEVSFEVSERKVSIIFAPLMLQDTVDAYWILTSFTKEGWDALKEVADQQWQLANAIAKSFYSEEILVKESRMRKLAELQLQKEIQGRNIIQELMDITVKDGEAGIGKLCQKAVAYLGVENIGIYLENKKNGNVERYFVWNSSGEDQLLFETMDLSVSEYRTLKNYLETNERLILDKNEKDPFLQEKILQSGMERAMILPITPALGILGYVVFADTEKSYKYEDKDVEFAACVTHIFESLLLGNRKKEKTEFLKESFFEVYHHVGDAIFIKDNKTGDIVFTNKAMDKLFGYSLVGTQARDVIGDQLVQYKSVGNMKKRLGSNKKVTKWQSYLKEVGKIMNIVEVRLESRGRQDYSLLILKKQKKS